MIPRQLLSYPEQLAKRLSDMEREIDKLKRELRNYSPSESGGGGGPTQPVYDGALTIQRNGQTVAGFSANQQTNTTANILVPAKTSDLTNDSGFITSAAIPTNVSAFNNDAGYLTSVSWSDVQSKPSFALVATTGDYNDLSNLPTIPVIPTDISAFNNDVGYLTSVDWTMVQNKPTFSTVASTGDYNDLINTPIIPPGVVLYNTTGYNTDGAMTQKATTDALDLKADISSLSLVATSGDYTDLINTPSLATVATTGAYSDLTGTPTIPTVNNATLTLQLDGSNVDTFTANASSNVTANFIPRKLNSRSATLRPTSANLSKDETKDAALTYFLASSSMTTGKPPSDGQIINMAWDNNGGYGAQLAVTHDSPSKLYTRTQNGGTWTSWVEYKQVEPSKDWVYLGGASNTSSVTNGQVLKVDIPSAYRGSSLKVYADIELSSSSWIDLRAYDSGGNLLKYTVNLVGSFSGGTGAYGYDGANYFVSPYQNPAAHRNTTMEATSIRHSSSGFYRGWNGQCGFGWGALAINAVQQNATQIASIRLYTGGTAKPYCMLKVWGMKD